MNIKLRKKMITIGFEFTSKLYTTIIKRNQKPWGVSKASLLKMNSGSLGHHLGLFLEENGFETIPRAERHDCFHVLTNYNTKVESEIGLQYLRLGNGARSIYTFAAVIAGTLLLPEYYHHYKESFLIGKKAANFQKLDFRENLNTSLEYLRLTYFSTIQLFNPIS